MEVLSKKNEPDKKKFKDIKTSLTTFQDRLSKIGVEPNSSIESCFKSLLALILDLVFQLATNAS